MTSMEHQDGNVGVRYSPVGKRGREVTLFRQFEDAGGIREFTLFLSRAEFDRLLDVALELDSDLNELGS